MKTYATILPMVNQIEVHPFFQRRDICEYCLKNNIIVEAYSPLTRAKKLKDPTLVKVAAKHGKTVAQVLVQWGLQHGYVSLPKSTKRERIIENAALAGLTLDASDMKALDDLEAGQGVGWDPTAWE